MGVGSVIISIGRIERFAEINYEDDKEYFMNLWQDFQTNQGKTIHKWANYFPVYERHFLPWRNKSLTFIEIGVSKGGSLQMWKRFFGPMATIIGVDIDPACVEHQEEGIHVRIGDQSDSKFLASLLDEFGPPDVVLDDGSHVMDHINKSFEYLYPKLTKNGLYMIEDLHTAYWVEYGGGIDNPQSFINISKHFIDQLNAGHSRGQILPDFISKNTFSISYYDSIIVFERGTVPVNKALQTGRQ